MKVANGPIIVLTEKRKVKRCCIDRSASYALPEIRKEKEREGVCVFGKVYYYYVTSNSLLKPKFQDVSVCEHRRVTSFHEQPLKHCVTCAHDMLMRYLRGGKGDLPFVSRDICRARFICARSLIAVRSADKRYANVERVPSSLSWK